MTKDYALLFNGKAVVVFDISNNFLWKYIAERNTILFTSNLDIHALELEVPADNVSFVRNFNIEKLELSDFIHQIYGNNVQITEYVNQHLSAIRAEMRKRVL